MSCTLERIKYLISVNRLDRFYHSKEWNALKKEVLEEQHYECQLCKEKYHRLTILRLSRKHKSYYTTKNGWRKDKPIACVHHVREVKLFPELALCKYYLDAKGVKQRQLIALCPFCHNELHNRFQHSDKTRFVNEERW